MFLSLDLLRTYHLNGGLFTVRLFEVVLSADKRLRIIRQLNLRLYFASIHLQPRTAEHHD